MRRRRERDPETLARLAGYELHTCEAGDTLPALAERLHVPLASLTRANELGPGAVLSAGQTLWVPPR